MRSENVTQAEWRRRACVDFPAEAQHQTTAELIRDTTNKSYFDSYLSCSNTIKVCYSAHKAVTTYCLCPNSLY